MPFTEGGKPGPGRPKGLPNQRTMLQREFADRIIGADGSPEEEEYIQSQRKLLLAGELHPAIHQTLLYYKRGKPTEVVEVQGEVTLQRVVREVIDINAEPPHQLDAVH